MSLPSDGFWHCKISFNGKKQPAEQRDMSYEHIMEHIVIPYRRNKEFNVGGKVIHSRKDIDRIKLFHTPNKFDSYGKKSPTTPGVYFLPYPLAWRHATEHTQLLLYSKEFSPEFAETKPTNIAPSQVININQNNNQSQSTEINISFIYSDIESLQEMFELWRSSLIGLSEADYLKLKEAQDALDSLAPASTQEQACGALNKIKRILKVAGDGVSTISRATAGATGVLENIGKLKAAYNAVAATFGFPPI